MGTPEFAVPSLKSLVESNSNVVAVITVPDKPAGRGQKQTASPVKLYAEEQGIPVLQPEKLKNPEFLEELKVIQCRPAGRRCISNAAGSGLEHANKWHIQFAQLSLAAISWRGTN